MKAIILTLYDQSHPTRIVEASEYPKNMDSVRQ